MAEGQSNIELKDGTDVEDPQDTLPSPGHGEDPLAGQNFAVNLYQTREFCGVVFFDAFYHNACHFDSFVVVMYGF